jgi:phytoene dehydrogenase-like protein
LNHPIELGAEFVHGLAPEIWFPLQQNNLNVTEVEGDFWCSADGRLRKCDFFEQADKILAAMDDDSPDESFLDFLNRRFPGDDHADAKQWATGYVSGFNAADPAEASVHWLVHNRHAEEQIGGDRALRIHGGYHELIEILQKELTDLNVPIHLNNIVRKIQWDRKSVQIETTTGDAEADAPAGVPGEPNFGSRSG